MFSKILYLQTGRGSLIKKQTITIFYFLPAPFLYPCFCQPYYLKLSHVVSKLSFFFNPLCSSILPSLLPSSLYRVATKIGFTFPHLPKRWNYKQKLNEVAGNIVFFYVIMFIRCSILKFMTVTLTIIV
jgi:hypothetical protein